MYKYAYVGPIYTYWIWFLYIVCFYSGRHTGDNIKIKFQKTVITDYGILDKICFVLTDNASNMRKAFTAAFDIQDAEEGFDDPELWHDAAEYENQLNTALPSDAIRLSCFAHSLQLVIHDGIKGK